MCWFSVGKTVGKTVTTDLFEPRSTDGLRTVSIVRALAAGAIMKQLEPEELKTIQLARTTTLIAARALAAEAAALDRQTAADSLELQAVRAEMVNVRASAVNLEAPLLSLWSDEFPDEVLAVVCRFLGVRELGRLARVSRRFTERTLTERARVSQNLSLDGNGCPRLLLSCCVHTQGYNLTA